MPAVAKIRFVAATLLEDLDGTHSSDSLGRAQHYLCTSYAGCHSTNALSTIPILSLTHRSTVQFVRRVKIPGRSDTCNRAIFPSS
jgi:hypothetical protein